MYVHTHKCLYYYVSSILTHTQPQIAFTVHSNVHVYLNRSLLFLVKVSEKRRRSAVYPTVHVQEIVGVQCSCEIKNRKTTVPISSLEVFLWPDVLAFLLYEITAPSAWQRAPGIALGCTSTKLSAADASPLELSDKETKLRSHWMILPI